MNGYKSVKAEEGKIDIVEGTIKFIDNVTEYNKAYTLTGAKVTYAGAQFKIDDFKVMFANSKTSQQLCLLVFLSSLVVVT